MKCVHCLEMYDKAFFLSKFHMLIINVCIVSVLIFEFMGRLRLNYYSKIGLFNLSYGNS